MRHLLHLLFLAALTTSVHSYAENKVALPPEDIVAPFDGMRFQNIEPFEDKHFGKIVWWQFKSFFYRERWKKVESQVFFTPEQDRSETLRVTVINHSTVLIQMNGVNLLTDPHYSRRASPVPWAGPKRVIEPAVRFDDLPPIDAVLISHDHYDHLDIKTLQRLSERDAPTIYAGLGNAPLLGKSGIRNVVEMDWWKSRELAGVRIDMVPVQHWSARGTGDRRTTLWGGFVIRGEKQVFFAGDTGYGTGKVFRMIHDRYGDMDFSLIPIGAYLPRDFMRGSHVWPEESIKIHQDIKSKRSLGIHFGTFYGLTDEAIDDPPRRLQEAREKAGISADDFIVPVFGETYAY